MTKKTRYFLAGSAAVLVAGLGTGLVAYYGGGFPSLSASRSGPAELAYVPADATIVAYANVGEVMASQLRQRLKERMPNERGQQPFVWSRGCPRDPATNPGASAGPASDAPLFGLAPRGVFPVPPCHHDGGALLPHLFTLATRGVTPASSAVSLSVALSLGSPPLAVSQHAALRSPDFPPRLLRRRGDRPARSTNTSRIPPRLRQRSDGWRFAKKFRMPPASCSE